MTNAELNWENNIILRSFFSPALFCPPWRMRFIQVDPPTTTTSIECHMYNSMNILQQFEICKYILYSTSKLLRNHFGWSWTFMFHSKILFNFFVAFSFLFSFSKMDSHLRILHSKFAHLRPCSVLCLEFSSVPSFFTICCFFFHFIFAIQCSMWSNTHIHRKIRLKNLIQIFIYLRKIHIIIIAGLKRQRRTQFKSEIV